MPIGSVFGINVSLRDWNVPVQSQCKKTEHFQSSPGSDSIVQKHSALVYLAQAPKDVNGCTHLLVNETANMINKGVITDGKRGPT